jgi:vacuolar-type H+-ATPase subunit F/Vma7
MAKDIAVIGNSDSIEYFRFIGCDTYETTDGVLTQEQFDEINKRQRYKIILVTEEVFGQYSKIIRRRTQRLFPVVAVIPDIRGAVWSEGEPASRGIAFEELRMAVVRAVGQDISSM